MNIESKGVEFKACPESGVMMITLNVYVNGIKAFSAKDTGDQNGFTFESHGNRDPHGRDLLEVAREHVEKSSSMVNREGQVINDLESLIDMQIRDVYINRKLSSEITKTLSKPSFILFNVQDPQLQDSIDVFEFSSSLSSDMLESKDLDKLRRLALADHDEDAVLFLPDIDVDVAKQILMLTYDPRVDQAEKNSRLAEILLDKLAMNEEVILKITGVDLQVSAPGR